MTLQQNTLETAREAKVNLYLAPAKGNAKAIVHVNHGMCEHAARYERFMNHLAKNGYHAIAQDHRGHGQTEATDAPIGTFAKKNGWSEVVGDARAVNRHAKETFGDLPVVMFGHSMGSAVALEYVLSYPETISAAAIWNAGMSGFLPGLLANLLKIERALKGSDVASAWANSLTFEAWNKEFKPNRTAYDWLTRDEAEVDKYVADPLCGFSASIGMWMDLLYGINATADKSRYERLSPDLPFHIVNGDQDPCSSKGGSAKQLTSRLKKLRFTDVTTKIYADARHESLNETNRDEVMADFTAWLDARFG